MVWLVIGLALFRNEPIWHIVQQLDLADGPTSGSPLPGAAVAGRERLGEAPLAWLFGRLASCWANTPLPDEGLFRGKKSQNMFLAIPATPTATIWNARAWHRSLCFACNHPCAWGKVDVESGAADGTTFTMTMPRLPPGFRRCHNRIETGDRQAR
jgi:hypothetical protein